MPGRGQPWKGVGKGNPDRIGSGAIADGSITEADLDSALTTKVNSSGHEILEEGGSLPQRARLDFVGAGVVASDGIEDTTTVTIAGGGGVEIEDLYDRSKFWYADEFVYGETARVAIEDKYITFNDNPVFTPNDDIGGAVTFSTEAVGAEIAGFRTKLLVDITKNFRVVFRARKVTSDANIAVNFGLYVLNMDQFPGGAFPFASNPAITAIFRADGTGNWFADTDDDTTPNTTDTGITSDTVYHDFEIRSNPAVPNIEFLIDGAVEATYTTNLPTGSAYVAIGVQTNTTVTKSIDVDSMYIYQDR